VQRDRVAAEIMDPEGCPLAAFVNIVSGKWAIPILYRLIITNRPIRFRELQRAARPITQKELTKQLRLFEARGLVVRTVYAEVPARVEYEATAIARKLIGSLEGLAEWVRDYGSSSRSSPETVPISHTAKRAARFARIGHDHAASPATSHSLSDPKE
jgi:DNA-binding HxlR family transcriptional regulator